MNNFEMEEASDEEESRVSSGKMEEEMMVDDGNDTESDSKSVQVNYIDLSQKNKRYLDE
jgi:hypothetical protein